MALIDELRKLSYPSQEELDKAAEEHKKWFDDTLKCVIMKAEEGMMEAAKTKKREHRISFTHNDDSLVSYIGASVVNHFENAGFVIHEHNCGTEYDFVATISW